jgi:hypothetical protein
MPAKAFDDRGDADSHRRPAALTCPR